MISAYIFSLYVDSSSMNSYMYGSLSYIILFLIYLYLLMYLFFIGAEINFLFMTYVSEDDYAKHIVNTRQILNGETRQLSQYLRDEMGRLSEEWKFEEAQLVKDKLELLDKYNSKSMIGGNSVSVADIFSYDETAESGYVNFMHLQHGAVVQSLNLEYRRRLAEPKEELLSMAIGEIQRRFERKFHEIITSLIYISYFCKLFK